LNVNRKIGKDSVNILLHIKNKKKLQKKLTGTKSYAKILQWGRGFLLLQSKQYAPVKSGKPSFP